MFSRVKEAFLTSRKAAPYALHSRDALARVLQRERVRCFRIGGNFALLTIQLCNRASRGRDLQRLIEVLSERLRATDDAGLLESDCVGVVLAHTDAAGAWKFAEHLAELLEKHEVAAAFKVEVYPANEDDNGDGDVPTEPHETDPGKTTRLANDERTGSMVARFSRSMPVWKRFIDVAGAASGLFVLSPMMIMAALAVRLTSAGPVFYKQKRAGLGGKPFLMYKFRSMVVNADEVKDRLRELNEQDGPAFKIERDPRVTRVGRWLRTTSIDELPQLWNVLKGDMSLVGPRPLPVEESAACTLWQRRRLDVTPGLTCIWQVNGRSRVSFKEWARMDIQYVQTRSLSGDLGLLLKTVPAVLRCEGAS